VLTTLMDHGIFIPSGCGGKGTCAYCKCAIERGGGQLLPAEIGLLTRKERMEGVRLTCQVKVKEDLKIRIPPEYLQIRQITVPVVSNRNVATFIKELVLELPECSDGLAYAPGQYVQIHMPPFEIPFTRFDVEEEYRDAWDRYAFWKLRAVNDDPALMRAYSLASYPAEGRALRLNVRIATPPAKPPNAPPGLGSSYLFALKPGQQATISGPYGDFLIKDTDREMLYLGGGAGMAPMRSHLMHLFHTQKTARKVTFWYGARSVRELFYVDDFRAIEAAFPNFMFVVALSDKQSGDQWDGPEGFIHNVAYEKYLKTHPDPAQIEYYMCGPPVMIEAAERLLAELRVPSSERSPRWFRQPAGIIPGSYTRPLPGWSGVNRDCRPCRSDVSHDPVYSPSRLTARACPVLTPDPCPVGAV
ncbi:MAG: NADH:ubiquinone reductase (Na(+)-transporting) subunit F, partial [Candidatus Eisenbacteria bacterium]|nr:NADH:ubiquinone reductase (Na(+)-transporting) subunit F [Candidatus Eisenbacteria bacterium]